MTIIHQVPVTELVNSCEKLVVSQFYIKKNLNCIKL